MLIKADYGDRLSAPSTYHEPAGKRLLEGRFEYGENNTFDFVGYNELKEYQGYGPYRLVDSNGHVKMDAEEVFSTGFLQGTLGLSKTSRAWEQPLYNYTEEYGPVPSGHFRRVEYTRSGKPTSFDPLAGDDVPYLLSLGELAATKGAWAIEPHFGAAMLVLSLATAVNNMWRIEFTFQVSYSEPYNDLKWTAQ